MKVSSSGMRVLSAVLLALGGHLVLSRPAQAAGQGWEQSISNEVTAIEYHASPGRVGLEAPNRAQNLRTFFHAAEIAIVARDAEASGTGWSFGWRLARWGRPGAMLAVAPAVPYADGPRVTYVRAELSEWYENQPEGVEQGFDVYAAPAGDGPLCLEGAILGGLAPILTSPDTIELVDERGDCVLRYDHLQVLDAAGRELPAELSLENGRVAIRVDDRGARYPIAIDPLMTNAAWIVESNQNSAEFGMSVATAGDVNGDGFSDVIVGAPSFDNGETNEGRAFLYLGSATGLATTPTWTAESNQPFAGFGGSVAPAGDVNGDGYADVIVGAENWSNDEQNEGRALVYLGSATGLSTTAIWSVESNQGSAYFGMSVGTAGDVNGDGYSDVIVGATFYDNDQMDEGRTFVYHGKPTGVSTTPAWTAESNQTQSWFGSPVATAGDVNGDGYSDVIVGANNYANGEQGEGRVYVYHGSATGLLANASWTSESNQAAAHYASSVAAAGDVDGDGYGDVIVGASQYNNGQSLEGKTFVYMGTATGLPNTAWWTAESNQVGAHFGNSVATAGDINADGYADVIIGVDEFDNGQSQEGRAVVYLGGIAGLDQTPIWSAESNQADGNFGQQVATAGDVNGDGFSDVIVGAPWYDNGQDGEGRAFVFLGAGGGTDPYPSPFNMAVQQDGAMGGSAVASAGDVNGDGYSDFVIGAPFYDNGQTDEGAGIVYLGEPDDTSQGLRLEFNQADAHVGTSIAGAGDINGDGYADVIVGAPDYDNGQNNEGRVSVYLGSASGVATSPAWTVESNTAEARFGASVASAGDVNGDGYLDVIIGAPEFDNGQDNEGKAFVYLGSATGLATSPAWTAESNQVVAGFGYSVASAGDVNRDGFSDILVGSYLQDNGENNEGRAFLYKGSASGLATSPSWSAESNQAGANFGTSVASAGDVNGDGFSDVIVGAPGFDNGQGDEGRAFVYLGGSGGLATSAAWTGEGGQNGAQMGFSVASAGDVNLDGFSDVVIGLPYGSNGETEEGEALVIHGSASGLLPAASVILDLEQEFSAFGWAVASAGDINGDGFADVLVGAPLFDSGVVDGGWPFAFMGNDHPENFGRDRIPRQARSNDAAPIGLLGKSQFQNGFLLKALGRTSAGRGRVWFEAEVKPLGEPFDGQDVAQSPRMDTGAPAMDRGSAVTLKNNVFGVQNNTSYRWRLRLRSNSPFFPGTPWFNMAGNAATETDLRTGGVQIGIEEPAPVATPFMLERIHPNPFVEPYELAYELPATGAVRLVVYDVQGRVRALLADGVKERGRHVVRWNPLTQRSGQLERGVYFVRLTVGARVETQKLILAP